LVKLLLLLLVLMLRLLFGRRRCLSRLLVQQHGHELFVVDVSVAVNVGLADQLLAFL
jgi:hypothetical protein